MGNGLGNVGCLVALPAVTGQPASRWFRLRFRREMSPQTKNRGLLGKESPVDVRKTVTSALRMEDPPGVTQYLACTPRSFPGRDAGRPGGAAGRELLWGRGGCVCFPGCPWLRRHSLGAGAAGGPRRPGRRLTPRGGCPGAVTALQPRVTNPMAGRRPRRVGCASAPGVLGRVCTAGPRLFSSPPLDQEPEKGQACGRRVGPDWPPTATRGKPSSAQAPRGRCRLPAPPPHPRSPQAAPSVSPVRETRLRRWSRERDLGLGPGVSPHSVPRFFSRDAEGNST